MTKYVVEIKEILTYYVTVEAEDHDDAWDEALKTAKYCTSDFDDNDAECVSIDEVPEEMEDEYEVDER